MVRFVLSIALFGFAVYANPVDTKASLLFEPAPVSYCIDGRCLDGHAVIAFTILEDGSPTNTTLTHSVCADIRYQGGSVTTVLDADGNPHFLSREPIPEKYMPSLRADAELYRRACLDLNRASLEHIQKERFKPAMKDGLSVRTTASQTLGYGSYATPK